MAKALKDLKLADVLPPSISGDRQVQDASKALDEQNQSLAERSAGLDYYSRLEELEASWLDHLAWQWHADVYEPKDLTVQQKRYVVSSTLMIHRYKGTPWAVKRALKVLGFERISLQEHWQLNSRPFTFAVKLFPLDETLIADARRIIMAYKPARSQLIGLELEKHFYDDLSEWLRGNGVEEVSAALRTLPADSEGAEDAARLTLKPFLSEYLWPIVRYGDEGLFYSASHVYSNSNVQNEALRPVISLQIHEGIAPLERLSQIIAEGRQAEQIEAADRLTAKAPAPALTGDAAQADESASSFVIRSVIR